VLIYTLNCTHWWLPIPKFLFLIGEWSIAMNATISFISGNGGFKTLLLSILFYFLQSEWRKLNQSFSNRELHGSNIHVKCVLIDVFLYLQIAIDWPPDFKITMDPVVSLKRPLSVDCSLCIFYQTYQASDPLSQATDHGLARNAADSRKKLRDSKYIDVIDRLENVFGSDMPKTLVWHRNCYGQFTVKK